jgi:hypothetical protein
MIINRVVVPPHPITINVHYQSKDDDILDFMHYRFQVVISFQSIQILFVYLYTIYSFTWYGMMDILI